MTKRRSCQRAYRRFAELSEAIVAVNEAICEASRSRRRPRGLAANARTGGPGTSGQLAESCGPRVLTYLARRTDPPADAADVYQEVLLVAWRRIDQVPDGDNQAVAWMLATARRCLANHRRGQTRRLAATQRLRGALSVTPAPVPVDDRLDAALADLAPDDRELLTLVYWDGLNTEEAGVVIGVGPAAARKRLERVRTRLRRALSDEDDEILIRITTAR